MQGPKPSTGQLFLQITNVISDLQDDRQNNIIGGISTKVKPLAYVDKDVRELNRLKD